MITELKAASIKERRSSVNMKTPKEDRTSRNSYKRIKLMVTKGTCASPQNKEECERVLSCKAKRMDTQVKSKRKRLEKELRKRS